MVINNEDREENFSNYLKQQQQRKRINQINNFLFFIVRFLDIIEDKEV